MEISPQEALDCFASDDLIGIGMEADAVRRALHPENVVTYAVPSHVALDQPTPGYPVHAASSHERDLNPQQSLPSLTDARAGDDLPDSPSTNHHASFEAWLELHRLAHRAGTATTASLTFGFGETSEDRVHRLFAIRALQAQSSVQSSVQSNRFTAFTLVAPAPGAHLEPPTAVEYLRTLAIARIVLDNIPNIESNCVAQGLKVMQMALRFGANDAGCLAASAVATKAAFTEEDLRRVIRDAGFTPVERDPLYRTLYLSN